MRLLIIAASLVALGVSGWSIHRYSSVGCGEYGPEDWAALSVVIDATSHEGQRLGYGQELAVLKRLEDWANNQPSVCVRAYYQKWIDASRRNLNKMRDDSEKGRNLAENGYFPRPSFVPVRK